MSIDTDTFSVFDYETGNALPGTPRTELVRESERAASGAVPGWYDYDASEWVYVAPSDVSRWEARGDKVRTVYVMPD